MTEGLLGKRRDGLDGEGGGKVWIGLMGEKKGRGLVCLEGRKEGGWCSLARYVRICTMYVCVENWRGKGFQDGLREEGCADIIHSSCC